MISNIGSRNESSFFYLTEENGIMVRCGCYFDSIDNFEIKVKEVHEDNQFANEYLNTIEYIKKMYEYYKSIEVQK